ncbi:MAG TPA: hypothetical protein VHB27_24400 [Rhodopila sp.]|uniref:hypothetical protein n=1 Tax=Rhodopila sp. TaxID=2480087 RepID=UPI002BE459DE|nr:hypothetical protein [Rhodopila sp.]HVY18383.1 hypothetical protein [Rhodopila sp.]
MLGAILAGLTDEARAEHVAAEVVPPSILTRIVNAAAAEGVSVGPLVAARVRHIVEHGGEAVWLDLLGVMSGSPQPGAAAAVRVLATAFPDPVRVRITRGAA